MIVRKAKITDVDRIVSIHKNAFKGFFLTSLGDSFLSVYYSCFIKSNETVILCAEEDGKLLGFSAATKVCRGFNGRMIKENALKFMMVGLRLLFTNPPALVRLVKNFTKKSDEVEDDENYGELYSIGVNSDTQGKGVGKALLAETETLMGIEKLSLTTDYYNNESTIAFYQKCGYQVLYEFTAYPNRKMLRMIKEL
jgi:ribosomal protein S18 acetylase RimI-like enzyme